ncbi:MAG: hypothetical protein B6245_12585 [Desulfobacteraceae bacterium 4572_88]|nr:MAG: hypothetical protein B6245_12585 [Desulfobacteraceae bacterium 4572_88]RLC02288.1 MAG: hypothetical protein DRI57_30235 [Deltaproteobacteria bacterium]
MWELSAMSPLGCCLSCWLESPHWDSFPEKQGDSHFSRQICGKDVDKIFRQAGLRGFGSLAGLMWKNLCPGT